MKFPVDLLAHVSQEELERSAQNYMNTLLYSNPDSPESITLSDSTEVIVNISTVGFVPLYGSSDKQKILALFTSTDPFTAVALYLLNRWWTISDILKTEDNDRNGAVEVQTVGERIVLYSLNRVIYRVKEMSSEELPFLCHGETDYAKILWHNGEAVGFYSVKLSGSLCSSFSTRSYQLPVMDSIYVRKCHRGNGYGLQMLKDYVLSFNDSCLGLRYPLATAMYKVCQKYLSQYPGDADLLWEVQSIGGPNQRTNIANKIQVMDLSVSKRLLYTEEPVVIMEEREKDTTTIIKETDSMKCTVEILEEVTVVKEADDLPVAAWDKSNGSKQWKIGENITEDKTEKVIRIEDIEAESPGEEQVSEQQITEETNISEHEDMLRVTTEGKTEVEAGKDSASMLDKTTTVQASEDLQSESTVAPAAEECQVEDKDLSGLNALCDSQIAIENVVSEIEEAHKKDSTVVSGEVLDVCKEAEMVEMEWGAKNEACEEELDEIVIQHVKGRSTHATSAKEKAEKRGQAVVKTVHNERPQLRSHRKAEEDGGRVLRGRTVVGSLASKCKSTQQSQKVEEKLESELSSAKEVDELARTESEYGRDLTAAPEEGEVVTENNKTDQEQKNEEVERSLIENEAKESDEEKEPPVVQRRALRARSKATHSCKSTRHNKRHQKQQDEHTDDLESQEFAREENIEQKVQEHHMEKDDTITKPQKDIPAIEINYVENKLEVALSTEENMKECKEVQEEGKTQELIDTEAVVEEGKEEEEAGTGIADVTEKCDSFGDVDEAREQNLPSVVSADRTEEPSMKSAGNSDMPKRHKAAVMLVDMKVAGHHLQVKNAEEIQATKVSTAAENEEMISTTAGASEKEDRISVVEQKELEPQQVEKVVEEEATEGDPGKDMENYREFEEKQCLLSETSADKNEDCTIQNAQQSTPLAEDNEGMSLAKEEVPLVQTRALRSGTITIIDIPGRNRIRKTEDLLSEAEKTNQKTEGKAKEETVEGGEACFKPDVEFQQEKGIAGEANSEQNIAKQQSVAIIEKVADKVVDFSGDVLQNGEDVEEKTMTGSGQENAADLTTATDESKGGAPENQNETAAVSTLVQTTEDEKILPVEAEQSEIVAFQLADLPRLSVVLVDLKKSQHGVQAEADVELAQEETAIEISVPGSFAVIAETRHGTKEKEVSVVTTQDLYDGKTAKAIHNDQDMEEGKSTEGDESAKETIPPLKSLKSTSATPRRKSKRAHTQRKIEEKLETEEAEPSEYTEIEENIAEEIQDNQEEKMQEKEETESTTQKEDNKESEADLETVENIVQESVSEQGASKDTVKGTVADESLDNIQTTDKVQVADEEEAPATKTTFLESDHKTIKATQDEEEEEEKYTEEGKPVIETRVLRSGKKCAVTISRRISKTTCTQSQTEEDDVEGGTAPIKKIQLEEAISKETQNNQEKMTEDTEKADVARVNNKESETDVEKEPVAEESLPEQGTIEETPPTQSVEDLPTTEEANTTNEEDIADTEEGKSTDEDELAKEIRVLRHGRKSAPATSRRKSKRAHKQLETEEDEVEEDTAPTKKIPLEGGISKEIQEEKTEGSEKADAATQKEDAKETEIEIHNQEVVAEKSIPEQSPVEETPPIPGVEDLPATEEAKVADKEEIPVLARRVLSSGQKTVKATQDEQDTDTEEDELAKETRVLRRGRNSASATPRRKSKRAHIQPQTEEKEVREYTASDEEMQVEEISAEETQDNQGEKMEEKEEIESTTQKEDNKDSEVNMEIVQNVAEESVSEQGASKDTVKGTVADESLDNIQTTDKAQAVDEKEAPAAKTTFLENDRKTMKATQDEEEEGKKYTEEGKPVIETRVLRSGKKCAVTISRRISKRTCTQSQTEEDDVEDGTAPIKKIQLEEAISKETQNNQEEMTEDSEKADVARADNKESETDVEKEPVAEESLPEQGTVEETPPTQSVEDLPTTEEANTTNEEDIAETDEDKSTEEDEPTETKVLRGLRKSASATPRRKSKRERKQPQTEEKEETEAAAPSEYIQIEETIGEEPQDNQEVKTEDGLKDETTTQKEDDRKSETEEAVIPIPKQDQIEEQEDETNKEENILIKMTDTETSSEMGDDLYLDVDADEEMETVSLNQEKEDEQSLSEEDEQIVIRGKVLRGRSVPSIIITPKCRRHSTKVQKAKESSSDEDPEHKPKRKQSAKRSSQKRQSSEITPNRRSKRHRI